MERTQAVNSDDPAIARPSRFPWRLAGWSAAALLLALPLVAMQFTREVAWTPGDFLFAAVMLAFLGGSIELAAARSAKLAYRVGLACAALACFLILWATGAVGIIGSENNPANTLYLVLVAGVLVGWAVTRLRARGLALVSFAGAAGLALIAAYAIANGIGTEGAAFPRDIIGGTAMFGGLFLLSGLLLRKSVRG